MDEPMNEGFAIPGKKPMFEEGEAIGGELFKAFANDTGDMAIILATIDAMADEGEEAISDSDLQSYAMEIMDGADDYRDLKVGNTFEGENAEADASAEAGRLDEEYNPGDGASVDELVSAIDAAKSDTTVDEENALSEAESMPTSFGAPDTDAEKDLTPMGYEEDEEEMGYDEDPMVAQLKKAKKL